MFSVCLFFCFPVSLTCVCPQLAFAFVDTVRHISNHLELVSCPIKIIRPVVVAHQIFRWVVSGLLWSECSAAVVRLLEVSKDRPGVNLGELNLETKLSSSLYFRLWNKENQLSSCLFAAKIKKASSVFINCSSSLKTLLRLYTSLAMVSACSTPFLVWMHLSTWDAKMCRSCLSLTKFLFKIRFMLSLLYVDVIRAQNTFL